MHYEGQAAAIELEWLADQEVAGVYPFEISGSATPVIIDTRPLGIVAIARDIREGVAKNCVARRFHSTIAAIIVKVSGDLRGRMGLNRVVLERRRFYE